MWATVGSAHSIACMTSGCGRLWALPAAIDVAQGAIGAPDAAPQRGFRVVVIAPPTWAICGLRITYGWVVVGAAHAYPSTPYLYTHTPIGIQTSREVYIN